MIDPVNFYIGSTIKELRKAAKLTQPMLAFAINVPYQSVQRMEAGKVHFRAPLLFRLSQIFGVSVSYLFGLDPSKGFTPSECRVVVLLAQMSAEDRLAVEQACIAIKNGASK